MFSGVAFRYELETENRGVASPSKSTTRTWAVADGLPFGANKATVQFERRALAKRTANTTPEKQKSRRIAESSDDDSDDTADEAITLTAKEESRGKQQRRRRRETIHAEARERRKQTNGLRKYVRTTITN